MILVCAATRTEAAACRQGLSDACLADAELLVTGVGPAHAAAALSRRLVRGPRPTVVVSSGFAGALDRAVPLYATVSAAALHRLVAGRAAPVPLPPGLLRLAPAARACHLLTAGEVVWGGVPVLPSPSAVDMESAALAEVTAAAGVAFLVLRVVTDTPDAPLPDFARSAAAALSRGTGPARAAHALRCVAQALRTPSRTVAFVRASREACRRLRACWRDQGAIVAAGGTPAPVPGAPAPCRAGSPGA